MAAALEWFRSTLAADTPPSGLSPPLQALWYAGKTEFNMDELYEIFDRIGGNGTAADGTVYAPGTSPPPETAGPEGSAPWLWTVGHAICQTVEYGYNPGNKPDQPPNDPGPSPQNSSIAIGGLCCPYTHSNKGRAEKIVPPACRFVLGARAPPQA